MESCAYYCGAATRGASANNACHSVKDLVPDSSERDTRKTSRKVSSAFCIQASHKHQSYTHPNRFTRTPVIQTNVMHLSAFLATVLGFQLIPTMVLAKDNPHQHCQCIYRDTGLVDERATALGCDDLDHANMHGGGASPNCAAEDFWGIRNDCWQCKCDQYVSNGRALGSNCWNADGGRINIDCGGVPNPGAC
ncbi:unnamed protein product [Zymoseptoria tritici ST99CH_3D1]|nr:unnamed protein product [Zymoseptoria tritici ST99CH_3D1]